VSGKQDCHQSTCVANKKPPKALNNTKFCCCNSDLCNMNVSDVYVASQADDPRVESPGKKCVRDVMARADATAVGTELSLGAGGVVACFALKYCLVKCDCVCVSTFSVA
jgi:hypothetical protein